MLANVVADWKRRDIPQPVMSASSGPKDYLKNSIWAAFNQVAAIDRIVMVIGGGPAFCLFHCADGWRDAAAKVVQVAKA